MLSNIPNPILKNQIPVFTQNGQTEPPPRKLLDRVRDAIRVKHNSYQTEKSYVEWGAKKLMLFNAFGSFWKCGSLNPESDD